MQARSIALFISRSEENLGLGASWFLFHFAEGV
jgi:hypothetical protein